jgi:hypothetical protein
VNAHGSSSLTKREYEDKQRAGRVVQQMHRDAEAKERERSELCSAGTSTPESETTKEDA